MHISLKNIQQEKCPSCSKEKVFQTKGNVLLFKMPQMKETCSNCGFRFEKEPGYFTGAMYISYGLCIIEMVAVFLALQLTAIPSSYLIYFLSFTVLLLSPFNFRMSRIIWMHLV